MASSGIQADLEKTEKFKVILAANIVINYLNKQYIFDFYFNLNI